MRRLTENQAKTLAYLAGRDWTERWRVGLYAGTSRSTLDGMVARGLIEEKALVDRANPGQMVHTYRATKKGGDAWRALEKPLEILRLAKEMKSVMKDGVRRGPPIYR